jgi:RHH-type rel operon transcriptional repressor/antitoxin RelB
MLAVRLTPAIEKRLNKLAKSTGRPKSYYVREALSEHLDDLEDAYLGAATLERVMAGKERTFTMAEVRAELGLDD